MSECGSDPTELHAVLFDKGMWKKKDAMAWLRTHQLSFMVFHDHPEHLRFTQTPVNSDYIYRTRQLGNGIALIFGFYQRVQGSGSGSYVQSVLFDRPQWGIGRSHAWLKKNGFAYYKVDIKPNHLRWRQVDPVEGHTYRMHHLGNGVSLIIGFI